jgi:uncharacterized Tic20 family protein
MKTRPEDSAPEEPIQPEGIPEEPASVGMPPEQGTGETPAVAEEVVEAVSVEEAPVQESVMGTEREVFPPPPPPPGTYAMGAMAQDSDDRTWSMIAHLSVLLNLVTGILGPIVALIIYLVYKDRSRYIAYQSMQSFVFQLVCWVGAGLVIAGLWIVNLLLIVVVVGLVCIPFTLILTIILAALPIVSLVYGVIGAVETSQGKDFRYLWVGDWVRGILET